MGPLSILLLAGALNGLLLAAAIAAPGANRSANRFLAALIGLVSFRLGIYIAGFAGAYDRQPWLTFFPFDLSLAFGPLLWAYVATLTAGAPPAGWRTHFVPAALQLAYYTACFCLPLGLKTRWYAGGHLRLVEPAALSFILLSAAAYLGLSWQRYVAYQSWLDDHFGNREQWRLGWLQLMLGAFAILLALAASFALWNALLGALDYFARLPVMLGFCALVYVLGLLGWRHGASLYPHPGPRGEEQTPAQRGTDYRALAAQWTRRIEAGAWWREEALTLGGLAGRLGVSERTVSRGLGEGAGLNFNAFINGFRVRAVQAALADPRERRDLLTLALDSGFNSKASFNRAFRAAAGTSPSQWRRAEAARLEIRQNPRPGEIEATEASG